MTYNQQNDIPKFLRIGSGLWSSPTSPSSYQAYGEGWALYSEHLGHEMGLYEEDPYQLIGFYSFNLLRACRLVIDTGIHALNWTRKQAVDYMLENSIMTNEFVELEIDRYITWPGQATAYKIGEQHIKKLRGKFEQNSNFDLKEFHKAVLDCYGPLTMLEECILLNTDQNKKSNPPKSGASLTKTHNFKIQAVILYSYFIVKISKIIF